LILVAGATGLVGRLICEGLRARGVAVRALSRSPSPSEDRLRALGCEIVRGDLKDASSLAAACHGAATAITTANAMMARLPEDSLQRVDRDGSLALVHAASAAGVRQFIYMSLSPTLPDRIPFVQFKRQVESAVRASGMQWTILQPTAFMQIHAGPVGGWDLHKGQARILGSGKSPISYISIVDVAAFTVESVFNPLAADRSYHLAGPEPLSALDAVRIAERVTGRRFAVQRVPLIALRLGAAVLGPFKPALASLLQLGVSLDSGEVVDMAPVLRDLPVKQETFEQYVRNSFSAIAHDR
jgi:NADH dehydrogenase